MVSRWLAAAALLGLAPSFAAAQTAGTVGECLKEVRAWASAEQARLIAEGLSNQDAYYQVRDSSQARYQQCAEKFPIRDVAPSDLREVLDLYGGSQSLAAESVRQLILRIDKELNAVNRAQLLAGAVSLALRAKEKPDNYPLAERLIDRLTMIGDTDSLIVDAKIAAHRSMNGFYRYDDVDAGIIKHSTALIGLGRKLSPELRRAHGTTLIAAYENIAEALAGQQRTADAVALLQRAPSDLEGVDSVEQRVQSTLDRYLLVGTEAAPIPGAYWINAPEGTTEMDLKGKVTLVEFTAHWCGPCRESYPGIRRLLDKYQDRGLQVVFVTEIYGHFEGQDMEKDAELEADRKYFLEKHQLDLPIAINERPAAEEGRYVQEPTAARYRVGGIPQIHLIDRNGIHRLIMVGYDEANEKGLEKLIVKLLNEGGGKAN